MNKNYIFSIVLGLSLVSVPVYGQKDSTLHQTMTVERDFSPIVRDANKIDLQPSYEEPTIQKSPTTFSSWEAGEARSNQIGHMAAGQVIAQDDPYKRGYLEFSAGNYWNADLKAGLYYKEFTVNLNGFFTNGNYDLPYYCSDGSDAPQWKNRMLNGDIKVGYDHMFPDGSRIRAHVGAGGRNYNMLNQLYTGEALSSELCQDLYPIGYTYANSYKLSLSQDMVKNPTVKQKLGNVNVDVSYERNGAFMQLGFDHSGLDLPDLSENEFTVKGGYGLYEEDGWQLIADLNMGMQFCDKNYFTIMPELHFSVFGDGRLSRFYVDATGGIRRPNLYQQMLNTPYAFPSFGYGKEKQLFDVTLGYEDNEKGYLKWGVYAGTSLTLDELYDETNTSIFSPEYFVDYQDKETLKNCITFTSLAHDDRFEFKAGAYLDYEYGKVFAAKGDFHLHTNSRYCEPLVNLGVHFISNPVEKFKVDLSFDGGFKREGDFYFQTLQSYSSPSSKVEYFTQTVDLGNIADLGLRFDYKFKDDVSFFLFGKNLLCQEYQLWPGLPAQKFNVHLGFNWIF